MGIKSAPYLLFAGSKAVQPLTEETIELLIYGGLAIFGSLGGGHFGGGIRR
jgi:hypothetical protein